MSGEPGLEDFHGVVAIDGPSGSGKSTIARKVAVRLGFDYLDTGAMYRAVCWLAMHRELSLVDQTAVGALAREIELFVSTDPRNPLVLADGIDVTTAIRETVVSEAVSEVATNLAVREELGTRQRAMIARGDVVVEGRDTTTVIAPDAEVRILLTASVESRLSRRTGELHVVVDDETLEATRRQVIERDERDSTVVEFFVAADGVVTVDTSDLDLEASIEAVLQVVAATAGSVPGPVSGCC